MDYVKKNLEFGTRVRVIKTNSTMDGIEGTISGIAMIHIFDTYIVSLKAPKDLGAGLFQSFIIPETCLEIVTPVTKVFNVKPQSRGTKRITMANTDWPQFQQDVADGVIGNVEIRIQKTNELLFAFPGKLARLFYRVQNPYAPDFGYALVSYSKALKAQQKEAA